MHNKLNVLHVYKRSLPDSTGGIEKCIDTLCGNSTAIGINSIVLALSKHPSATPIEMHGYTVHQVKEHIFLASTGFSFTAFNVFRKLANKADIIHYHFPNPFADIMHLGCSIKKPSIVTYHSDIIKQRLALHIYQPLMHLFLNSVDCIVATSPNYLATSRILQIFSHKVSVIPIGIDINTYPPCTNERLTYWHQRLSQPFFLFVGAMRYYKGLHIAIDAVAGTNIQFAIAGINGIEKELKAHADSLNARNVHFLGFVSDDDKVALLELCAGFVFPSHLRSEAFGIALLEAAAFGKPMISCEIGTGTTFVNKSEETGLVVNPGSPIELRKAMQYLLDNPAIAATMGANAKKRAAELFMAGEQAQSYFDLYKRILSEKFHTCH